MEYFQYALIPISVAILMPAFIGLIQKRIRKKEQKYNTEDFIICIPLFLGACIFVMTIIFTIILILLNIFDGASIYLNIIMIPFLLCFYIGCYAMAREKIIIKGDVIKVIPFIGKVMIYNVNDIKLVKKSVFTNLTVYKAFSDKNTVMFSVSSNNLGYNLFITLLQKYDIMTMTIR